MIRPWLFLGPAILLLAIYLIYPVIATLILSFYGRDAQEFVGFSNYLWASTMRLPPVDLQQHPLACRRAAACTFFGLIIAVMTDRLAWGNVAKSLVFMPMAISFVGASVIWKFIYDYRGEGQIQIGILNSIVQYFGGKPEVWLAIPFWNNFFLMVILIWIQTGFAMVILSAALRGIPEETMRPPSSMAPAAGRSSGRSWSADLGHDRDGLDDHHHPRPQGLRYRSHHDQRSVEHGSSRQSHVRLDVPGRRRQRAQCGNRRRAHAGRHPDHDLEHPSCQRRDEGALKMSIGKRLARIGLPRLFINLTVLVVVALWVMPTLGIFVSSFRDKDQLTVSGWWTAFSSSERNEAGRLGGLDLMKQEGPLYVISGNVLEGRGGARSTLRHQGRRPARLQGGTEADLGDGIKLTINSDGAYRYTSTALSPTTIPAAASISLSPRRRSSRWSTIATC